MSPVLSVRDLTVSFASEAGRVDAVRGVSFDLEAGKTLGIVGESGSGKSVTSLAVMGLLDENAKVSGSIVFDGQELLGKTDSQLSAIRGNGIAMVFQDPLTSLTPVYTIGELARTARGRTPAPARRPDRRAGPCSRRRAPCGGWPPAARGGGASTPSSPR